MLSNLVGKSISLVESSIYFKIVDILDGNFLFRNVRIIRKIKEELKHVHTPGRRRNRTTITRKTS